MLNKIIANAKEDRALAKKRGNSKIVACNEVMELLYMKDEDLTVEDMHRYLGLSWFGYNYCDKDQLTEIIQDELSKSHDMPRDKLKLHIKRRCQAETGR